ncbi:S9 family peptidase [Anaeromyxobacter dehalogenans]|uniref:Peptidase S9, prolyl oligopeptidase active site region n=1 Tax=Anaeromyxobacter dehalogenans (strain 2CP-C) TaxID=290397 RepID=Q2IP31_ANADE|nr:prolyl oligopeptidase family serine peptidase [Anaeromyxobacter dehalogenans]ABC80566.1 peptidase S9, prolyl oligopeptidase active site region [Anaeromyxobacter dehalogenans 2CP-C]
MHALLLALVAAAGAATAPLDLAPVPGLPNLLQLGVPEVPPEVSARLEQYENARAAVLRDVSADGRAMLVTTRFGSTAQLHLVAAPLGTREQLTFGDEPVSDAAFLPGRPDSLLYLQDEGGGEFFQLYRLDRRTGRSELLTDGRSRHGDLVVSPDGRRFAYSGTGRNGKDADVYVAETDRPAAARRAVEAEGSWSPLDFSRDGRRLLVRRYRAASDADLELVDLATGARTPLLAGKGSVGGAAFSADGRHVYAITDRGADHAALVRVDLAHPAAPPRPVAPGVAWDVEQVVVARDGTVAFTANADGVSLLHAVDPRTGRLRGVPLPGRGVATLRFPPGRSDLLAVGLVSATSPWDAWTVELRGGKAVRWTRSEVGGLDPAGFVEPELVRYPTTGGAEVPAFLYRPRGGGRAPVVVNWHGGPEGQHRPAFSPMVQFLVAELGVAVLQPNVRGSAGYGKDWLALDDGVRREEALKDVPATFQFIASRPDLDAARAVVWGGSYGGYMVLATLTLFPGLARAGVDVVGISSLPSFLESTQAYRRDLRRAEYGDERVPEVRAVQERISPLGRAGAIRVPLLVVQGANDPRVPRSEAEQIVRAVRANGQEVWYVLALDEGHGFKKKENRDHADAVTVAFLQRMLAGAPPAAPPRGAASAR